MYTFIVLHVQLSIEALVRYGEVVDLAGRSKVLLLLFLWAAFSPQRLAMGVCVRWGVALNGPLISFMVLCHVPVAHLRVHS